MKLSDIARLSEPEETQSVKAERQRRSKEIRAGRHPDTGKRLTFGDRKTLKANDLFEFQMWKDTRLMSRDWYRETELERSMAKWREHQDLRSRMHLLGSSISDLRQVASQKLVGSTLDECIRTSTELRYQEPISSWRREINSAIRSGFELGGRPELYRPPQLHEFDRAMTTQITAFWRQDNDLLRYSPSRHIAVSFVQDAGAMEREASRMLGIYGRSLVEQPIFLAEYQANLGLFNSRPLCDSVFQAADLLARVALPTDLLPGSQFYDVQQVERYEAYVNGQLLELEQDFEFDGNPVHVFKAIDIACSAGVEPPTWAVAQVGEMAGRICEIGDRESSDGRLTEAQLVGMAAGFGKGKGATGQFAAAKQLQRDREISFAVEDWLSNERQRRVDGGAKLTSAYDAAAEQFSLDRSTIQRIYQRMRKYVAQDE